MRLYDLFVVLSCGELADELLRAVQRQQRHGGRDGRSGGRTGVWVDEWRAVVVVCAFERVLRCSCVRELNVFVAAVLLCSNGSAL